MTLPPVPHGMVQTITAYAAEHGAAAVASPPTLTWTTYFNQGVWWLPDGRPPIRIADMDAGWRGNAARWMMRRARRLADRVSEAERRATLTAPDGVFDDVERAAEDRCGDPAGWLTSTVLYRAMVDGLAVDAAVSDDLMAREGTR